MFAFGLLICSMTNYPWYAEGEAFGCMIALVMVCISDWKKWVLAQSLKIDSLPWNFQHQSDLEEITHSIPQHEGLVVFIYAWFDQPIEEKTIRLIVN
jgi:hypothetical protein